MPHKLLDLFRDERIRFVFVGGVNTVLGYLIFVVVQLLLQATHTFPPVIAAPLALLISHVISSVPAFFLYRALVFRVAGGHAKDFVRFQSVYVIPILINLFLLPLLVWLGWEALLAQAFITIFNVLSSYFGHKYFSFRRKQGVAPE